MALGRSVNRYIGFGAETTPGTKGTIDQFLRVVDMNLDFQKDTFMSESMEPGWHDDVFYRAGRSRGPIVLEESYEGLELLWHAMFGTYNFTANSPVTGTYTHAFTYAPSTNNHPVLSIEQVEGMSGSTERAYLGMHPTKATIEFAPGQAVKTTFDFAGMGFSVAAATSPTFATRRLVLPAHKSALSLGGNTILALSGSIEFTVPRDEGREHYGEAVFGEAIVRGRPTATFKLEGEWNNATGANYEQIRQNYEAGTEITGLVLGHQGSIITGATPRSHLITATKAFIKTAPVKGAGEVTTKVSVEGEITEGLSLVIVNSTSAAVT